MKDVVGFEGLYGITSCGRVWSYRQKKFMATCLDKSGYPHLGLRKDGKLYYRYIHRLVGEAYLEKPDGAVEINHKSENKQQNWLNNLEWVSHVYNMNYGTRADRAAKTRAETLYKRGGHHNGQKIFSPELNQTFASQMEASEKTGVDQGSISKCLRGKIAHAGKHPVTGQLLTWKLA